VEREKETTALTSMSAPRKKGKRGEHALWWGRGKGKKARQQNRNLKAKLKERGGTSSVKTGKETESTQMPRVGGHSKNDTGMNWGTGKTQRVGVTAGHLVRKRKEEKRNLKVVFAKRGIRPKKRKLRQNSGSLNEKSTSQKLLYLRLHTKGANNSN